MTTSYRMQIDGRSRKNGRFVRTVQKELQSALSQSGLRQQQVADKLGIHKSIVARRLSGHGNLTLRSIADLAWALDHDIEFRLKPRTVVVSGNEHHMPEVIPLVVKPVAPAIVSGVQHGGIFPTHSGTTTGATKASNSVMVRKHEPA